MHMLQDLSTVELFDDTGNEDDAVSDRDFAGSMDWLLCAACLTVYIFGLQVVLRCM
jgi:hypothetical protein